MKDSNIPIICESEAWQIAHSFATDSASILGDHFVAAVAVGSLPTGGYVPGRSDVDLIIIAKNDCPDSLLPEIKRKAKKYWDIYKFKKGFGGYAVRQGDLYTADGKFHDLAFEILQLKRQGRVIAGDLDLEAIPGPSTEHMRQSLIGLVGDIYGGWNREYSPPIDSQDARVNQILYWIRIFVWDRTGTYYLKKRDTLGAFEELPEAKVISEELDSVQSYVNLGANLPGEVDSVCRELESFVVNHVSWVRDAVSDTQ